MIVTRDEICGLRIILVKQRVVEKQDFRKEKMQMRNFSESQRVKRYCK